MKKKLLIIVLGIALGLIMVPIQVFVGIILNLKIVSLVITVSLWYFLPWLFKKIIKKEAQRGTGRI